MVIGLTQFFGEKQTQENTIINASEKVRNLVIQKNKEYSSAYPKIKAILDILYPNGIPKTDFDVLPKLERNIEKLCRLSAGHRDDIALDICGIWLNQVAEDLQGE